MLQLLQYIFTSCVSWLSLNIHPTHGYYHILINIEFLFCFALYIFCTRWFDYNYEVFKSLNLVVLLQNLLVLPQAIWEGKNHQIMLCSMIHERKFLLFGKIMLLDLIVFKPIFFLLLFVLDPHSIWTYVQMLINYYKDLHFVSWGNSWDVLYVNY